MANRLSCFAINLVLLRVSVADGEVGGRTRLRNLTFGRKYVQIIASISGMALLLAACEPPRPGRGATATPP
jgi:hypothetical protein